MATSDGQKSQQVDTTPEKEEKRVGCAHYKRRAKFVTPCCNKFYMCRYCHDENETHFFNRKTVTELICTECNTRQKVQAECEQCGVRFGRYTCLVCNLFDDEDRNQYHCDGCGICRVGGRGRFFHCEVCNMCLPLQLQIDGHRCVENVSRSNCPVCLDDIHTSRIPCHIPDCGHLLHRTCFEELLSSGHYACPTCQTSMMDMNQLWEYLDSEVAATPMPKEYENYRVDILCKDCHKESTVKFHVVGLKCTHCGAYNTCRTKTKSMDVSPKCTNNNEALSNGESSSNGSSNSSNPQASTSSSTSVISTMATMAANVVRRNIVFPSTSATASIDSASSSSAASSGSSTTTMASEEPANQSSAEPIESPPAAAISSDGIADTNSSSSSSSSSGSNNNGNGSSSNSDNDSSKYNGHSAYSNGVSEA
ncbi:RING finger and CHY zinc finger domain-containing protein 1 [Uranotaenia lowii]|uniref:RING finger and CHY zinc finger domain-containing protein 1 n=1 Tax=Uranotaenia lowii TaxID=190385 RepID=UPI002479191A|nr:RING finger and CHY zinc finger domain-containing protein 1 [Uranotaenia lowii]